MKFITIIFNILITQLIAEPIYKYQLKGLYEIEKETYFNNTINENFNQISNRIISNAKQNISKTYFDLYPQYFLDKQSYLARLESSQNSMNPYFNQKHTQQNKYQECYNYNVEHQNQYQYQYQYIHIPNYNSNYLPYDIPIELYITETINKLSINFPDCNIEIIKESPPCWNIYLISW
jgi:hypothetical protein